jgi:Tol biopolymer transport system component
LAGTPEPTGTQLSGPTPLGGTLGQVAFASTRAGLPQIYLINTDGSGLQLVTKMDNGACQPSWSPDGSRLVFISPCLSRGEVNDTLYNNSSLYLINADGTDLQPLTAVPGSDFDPAWSPDGKRIAFASLRDGRREIYVITLDTSAVIRLTTSTGDTENSQPSWSPFGNQIAYTVKRFNAYQVWVMSDTGLNKVQLAHSGQQLWDYLPAWLPDGVTVIFNQKNVSAATLPNLMSIRFDDRDTKDPARLDLPKPMEDVEFSPDGVWIIFETTGEDGNRDIYFSMSNGGERTRLTNDPSVDFDPTWRPLQAP